MTDESLDPYSAYLGLPAGARPPNYYELLDLELFCSHTERINQAVRKQFRVIKRFHDHHDRDTREAIQDIMNAIATARVVLTDPTRKEEYDIELAENLDIDREAHLSALLAAPIPEYEVEVIAGPTLVDAHFELVEGTRFVAGCDHRCSLTLNSDRAGNRHAVIHCVDGEWMVKPAGPDHPIYVNDHLTDEFVLAAGDRIDIAGYRLLFSRIDQREALRRTRRAGPPPLSLIVQKGPSIPTPLFNVLPPQRIVIGHSETALWQLPDRTISRQHCAIQTVGDSWEVEDLDSTNSTQVNGETVMRRLIHDRDLLTLGEFQVVVSLRF